MTCELCGYPAVIREKHPRQGVIICECPRCKNIKKVKMKVEQPRITRRLEEPSCRV